MNKEKHHENVQIKVGTKENKYFKLLNNVMSNRFTFKKILD